MYLHINYKYYKVKIIQNKTKKSRNSRKKVWYNKYLKIVKNKKLWSIVKKNYIKITWKMI